MGGNSAEKRKQMKRKKEVALLLLTAVLAAAGCADEKTTGEKTTESGSAAAVSGSSVFDGELEENVTIRVLENDTAISKGYFEELITAFNEAYADQGITAVDANMDQYLDLANDGPYGYGPDVLYQANDVIMQYAKGKHIYPLPVQQLSCYEQIPESAWKAYETTVDGTTYCCGVPVNVQAPMLYRKRICCRRTGRKTGMRIRTACRIWWRTGTICMHIPKNAMKKIRRSTGI